MRGLGSVQSQRPYIGVKAFELSFSAAKMLQLIHTVDSDEKIGMVYTGKKRVTLTAEQVTTAYVKTNTWAKHKGIDLLLVACEKCMLPEVVVIEEGSRRVPEEHGTVLGCLERCHVSTLPG